MDCRLPLSVSLETQEATSQAEWRPSIQGSEAGVEEKGQPLL